jgi:transposase InsO family protein
VKYAFVRAEKARWPVRILCRVLGVAPSGYYAWENRPPSEHAKTDQRLAVLIRSAHNASRRLYGSPRVHAALKHAGHRVGRKRVARLMREEGLVGRFRPRRVSTTVQNERAAPAENTLNREFSPDTENKWWVADVTFLRLPEGFAYLATVLDLYSRMVVGWKLGRNNDTALVLGALDDAVRRRGAPAGLGHHSDRGSTYTSNEFRAALESRGIACSMSRTGECLDNAVIESWHSTLKSELAEDFPSFEQAQRDLFDYIEAFYNGQRLHSTLAYQSPRDFERRARE